MIVKWIWDAVTTFLAWLLDHLPGLSVPAWVEDIGDYATQGVTFANGLHNWVPLDALRNSLVFLLACGGIAIGVRVARILISLLTGGGGGAA